MYGESFLSPGHPVTVSSQLVSRVDPLERKVLSLVLSQAAHACQQSRCIEVLQRRNYVPERASMFEEEAEL